MKNSIQSIFTKIQPYFWQELSRVSAMSLFAGWISMYYHRFGEVEAGLFSTWIYSLLTLILAAAFGAHYKHSHQNQSNIYKFLLPGFLLLLVIGLQWIRYPHDWPFLSEAYTKFHDSFSLENKIPMDFWHFFYMLILTWRGIRFGREPSSSDVHQKAFIGFFIFFILFQVLPPTIPPVNYQWYFFMILFSGVLGMPAARIVTSSMLRGGRLPKVQKEWIVTMLIGAIAFIILGVLSSFALNLSIAKILSSLLISLFTAIILLIFIAMTPLAYLFMFLFERFLQKLMANAEMPQPTVQSGQEIINQAQEQTQELFHQNVLSLQNYLIIAATVVLIIVIWYTLKQRGYQNRKTLSLEEGIIGDKTRKAPNENELRSLRDLLHLPGSYGLSAIRIRWIYANLCRYGKQLDSPRLPAITPYEYQQNLYQLFPENHTEIAEITNAYVAVRYGQVPESPEEIKKLQESWEVLENQARKFLQMNKKLEKQSKKKR
jgi:hypothetical protein